MFTVRFVTTTPRAYAAAQFPGAQFSGAQFSDGLSSIPYPQVL